MKPQVATRNQPYGIDDSMLIAVDGRMNFSYLIGIHVAKAYLGSDMSSQFLIMNALNYLASNILINFQISLIKINPTPHLDGPVNFDSRKLYRNDLIGWFLGMKFF